MKLILMMATTVDGIIAKTKDQKTDWTSPADKKAFVAETKKHGVIIMGSTTFDTIGKPLLGRLNLILTKTPEKYQDKKKSGVLEFLKGSPKEIVGMLKNRGIASAVLAGGARTNAAFLKAGLVDEILITVEPKIFGTGINFTEGEDLDLGLKLIEAKPIGDNAVQLRYKVMK